MGFPADQGLVEVAFQAGQVPTEDPPEARQLQLTGEHRHQLAVVTELRNTGVEVVMVQIGTMGRLLTPDRNMVLVGMED
jgi:hypothetical protein